MKQQFLSPLGATAQLKVEHRNMFADVVCKRFHLSFISTFQVQHCFGHSKLMWCFVVLGRNRLHSGGSELLGGPLSQMTKEIPHNAP